MEAEIKPWGSYEVLYEDESCKIKKLVVSPNQSLSLQYHLRRQEQWTVVEGIAEVVIGTNAYHLFEQSSAFIPYHANHQLINASEDSRLVVIEVQTGEYFGEDDIVRVQDPHNRE
jgi:mannose-6-phosphate isomerase